MKKETDPNGLDVHAPGAKVDKNKPRYSLIPTGPLKWLAILYTRGAIKYSSQGWRSVKNGTERYLDALIRHLEAHREGKWLDPDTKVPHIIAVAWNAFAICYLIENNEPKLEDPFENTPIFEKIESQEIHSNYEEYTRMHTDPEEI